MNLDAPRLQVAGLQLRLGDHDVLRGVDLALHAGELVGLIGPNGSGKSTLLRAIAGSLPPDRGHIAIEGENIATDSLAARRRLGFAVDPERLPRLITGRQCLEIVARLREEEQAIADSLGLAGTLGLGPWLDRPVYAYSLGTRQKLAVVIALHGAPSLILLDEVLNGLDPLSAWALKQALRQRTDAGATVLLATHGLEVAERLLDRAVLLLDGRIVADWGAESLARFRDDPEGGLEHAVAEWMRAHRAGGGSAATTR
ncbi:MAG: ATP-binding cassette domain-containing protein [Xanthomonadales bacterium]|nr:ATP-binding cassette domain-containing protein [Xanthomonadales bacterium]